MTVDRKTVRQDIISRLYSPMRTQSASTSGGSSTTILDSTLQSASRVQDMIGAWIYLREDNGPNIGEVARVVNFVLSTDTLTVAPAFSGTVATSTDYEIHYVFHPADVNDLIDDIIRIGTRSSIGAYSGGSESALDDDTVTLEQDVMVDGCLSLLKRRLAVGKNESETLNFNEEANFHEDSFREGLVRLGYPPLITFPT
jgi:hypothetical protein